MKDLLEFIDSTLARKSAEEDTPRDYLGASSLGGSCERKIWYSYNQIPMTEPFNGKTWRIFGRGHTMEEELIRWLRKVGFEIQNEDPRNGGQLGFRTEDIAGHIDGLITKSPHPDIVAPCILEIKTVGSYSFKQIKSKGIEKARPEYYAQINLYMHHMKYAENAGMFVALNADNMELYIERIDYNEDLVHSLGEKAKRIKNAEDVGGFQRLYEFEKNGFPCYWFRGSCSYYTQCRKDNENTIEEEQGQKATAVGS